MMEVMPKSGKDDSVLRWFRTPFIDGWVRSWRGSLQKYFLSLMKLKIWKCPRCAKKNYEQTPAVGHFSLIISLLCLSDP